MNLPGGTRPVVITRRFATDQGVESVNCTAVPGAAPRAAAPQITMQMLTAQAEKLLPHPRIRTTGDNDPTLVNIDTIFWIDTTTTRTLGTVTLLATPVTLRAHLTRITWNFGDHTTDTTTTAEPPYTTDNPCTTARCPDYYTHTYRTTGTPTITATITWTGQYRISNGPWRTITNTVAAPATNTTITVHQARSILVPNPGN